MRFETDVGSAHPVGVTVYPDGVNLSLFSQGATGVVLLLFDSATATAPVQTVRLDPFENKTFHFWHVFVRGCDPSVFYALRVEGPWEPSAGQRFNARKVLISPYSRWVRRDLWRRGAAIGPDDNLATSMRCAILDPSDYDWEGDRPLNRPIHESIIYEMHVGGFTRSPTSGAIERGTFSALAAKIPYLKALGVTAVELLPVFEFDDSEASQTAAGEALRNYWGYSTVGYFSPHSGFSAEQPGPSPTTQFRDLVKALHKAGIEVILDVVFNHTDEGNEHGPTYSFRGIDNPAFYMLAPDNLASYSNYSGVGNTFNANHPMAQKFIVDCLRYWVQEMHVDGFRFDEGSILSRGEDGMPLYHPPVIWQIELDDALADTKVIAEAWDAAGLNQVGHFPGDRWAEWNGRYCDDIRRFVKGDAGIVGAVASRIGGSSDIYAPRGQTPENSINFVTAHDGFTLNDLVSYNTKHNEANGEGNRDGVDQNWSWNCGVEGPTTDAAIEQLRTRQIKNFITILMLSRGVPMFVAGDEVRRTQSGNNNPYNQDNGTSWFDWSLVESNREMLRYFQRVIAFRKAHPALWQPRFYDGKRVNERGVPEICWHGTSLERPGFDDPTAQSLAFTVAGFGGAADLHVMLNMFWRPLDFEVPSGRSWRVAIDTSAASPHDIADPGHETAFELARCTVAPRGIIVLSGPAS